MKKQYYKVLDKNNCSCNGGSSALAWSLPTENGPGDWMPEVQGDLKLCSNGYHLTDAEHLLDWLNATIYEAEPSTTLVEGDDKIACRSVRLLRKMHWDDRIARLFACDCAERVLPTFERQYPDNKRPRHAIEVARLFAEGKATDDELAAAWNAARAAAWAAAWGAARGAARAAAWAAARAAAWGAAWAAAWNAARAAAWAAAWGAAWAAAWDAARDAARAAAWNAARDAARAAAGNAEHKWQVKRLMWYLEGK